LKYFLYRRALQQVFSHVQAYNQRTGRKVRCYVPTHSLINYAHWCIVSPAIQPGAAGRLRRLHRAGLDRHRAHPESLPRQRKGAHLRDRLPRIRCDAKSRARDRTHRLVFERSG
jgi:hypothetical protein